MESIYVKLLIFYSIYNAALGAVCKDPVDVVVVVDGSQSIGITAFETLKTNLQNFVQQLSVSDNGVNVGIVLYSSTVDTSGIIPLTGNTTSLLNRIAGLPYLEAGTNTNLGIDEGVQRFNTSRGLNIPRIMVVITDGFSDSPELTKEAAQNVRDEGITMFAVGVGAGVKKTELDNIALDPSKVSTANDFNVLIKTLTDLSQSICDTTTRTTTAISTTLTVTSAVCDECYMENGVGYQPHPTQCRMFIQCVETGDKRFPHEKHCPDSMFWNQQLKNCVNFYDSDCYGGECAIGKTYLYPSINNCGLYFNCTNLQVSSHCCDPVTSRFDATTRTCVASTNCTQCTPKSADSVISEGCDTFTYRPFYDSTGKIDPCKYNAHVGTFVVQLTCGEGTNFNPQKCDCSLRPSLPCATQASVRAVGDDCEADLYMSFTNNLLKDEVNNAWVGNKGVKIFNDEAIFSGTNMARLFINRYSNIDFTLPLAIKVVFNDAKAESNMAVLSTGGCIDKPSIYIAAGNGRVTLGVVPRNQGYSGIKTTSATISGTNIWKEVIYLFDGTTLSGQVRNLDNNHQPTSAVVKIPPIAFSQRDRIMSVSGALQLGYAHDDTISGFKGAITELEIWKGCKDKLSAAQYA